MNSDHLFMLGSYGVKVSDLISALAFLVSCGALLVSFSSSRASWRNTRREEAKAAAQKAISVEVLPLGIEHDVLRLKVHLIAPPDGSVCDLNRFQVVGHPRAVFFIPGEPEWPRTITLKAGDAQHARRQVNVEIQDFSSIGDGASAEFLGRRRDGDQSDVSARFKLRRPSS